MWRFFTRNLLVRDGNANTILHKCELIFHATDTLVTQLCRCSGLAKPGEMILVLGRPGSGCTTFLKAIANQRGEYSSVTGEVRYVGINAVEMGKTYKGEVVYNQEGA
jgi:ABC-type multidrug transport system ATPase subunit